jgi:Domain of unknown function (DUF932)
MSFTTAKLGSSVLDNAALQAIAPSIFATHQHESRSYRYQYIPTAEIMDGMRAAGFLPVLAKQGRSRIPGKADFTKHLIRFRPEGEDLTARKIGGLYPEVVLVNSHDGTSSYQVMSGLMRLVCLNGMIVSDRELSSVRITHTGDIMDKVIEGSFTVLEESRKAIEAAETWSEIALSRDEQQVLAEAAHVLRFGDAEAKVKTEIKPDQLLAPKRRADEGTDLWRTMNRIQENAIRGGLTARVRDADGRRRTVTTREVKAIDTDVKLNRALWLISEHMAALKIAA